jgi:hypothetical protein
MLARRSLPLARWLLLASSLVPLAPGLARAAGDGVEIKWGGLIASDIRYRLASVDIPPPNYPTPYPSQRTLLKSGWERNETTLRPQMTVRISDRVKAVGDLEFVWYGFSDAPDINALTLHERIDPYRLELHAAYLDVYKILPGLDLRVGRQVVAWGSADKFNPTSNLSTLDYSDPLLFGRPLANNMVRLDWNPKGDFIFTGVFVPVFRPAQLPRTAPFALTQIERPLPVQEASIRNQLGTLAEQFPPTALRVTTLQPEPSIRNSPFGFRVAGRVLDQDVSISYYKGRFGIPLPVATARHTDGSVDVAVTWPGMQVLGADIAGSLTKLGGIGYWVEGGVYFPQQALLTQTTELLPGQSLPITWQKDPKMAGNYIMKLTNPGFDQATLIPDTPFFKLTAGIDYSWNKYLYTNLQYVHGFIDEFGAGTTAFPRPGAKPSTPARVESRLGDYMVVGADLKLRNETILLRLFGVFKMPSPGDAEPKFTAVIYPQVAWTVIASVTLSVGGFIFLGDSDTKFGDPAAGGTVIFTKGQITF